MYKNVYMKQICPIQPKVNAITHNILLCVKGLPSDFTCDLGCKHALPAHVLHGHYKQWAADLISCCSWLNERVVYPCKIEKKMTSTYWVPGNIFRSLNTVWLVKSVIKHQAKDLTRCLLNLCRVLFIWFVVCHIVTTGMLTNAGRALFVIGSF